MIHAAAGLILDVIDHLPHVIQKSEFHLMQHQLFMKGAITLKLETLFAQNLTLRKSIVSFMLVEFMELIKLKLIDRDAKHYGVLIVGIASRGKSDFKTVPHNLAQFSQLGSIR